MRISGRRGALYGSSLAAVVALFVWSRWPEPVVVPPPPPPPAGPVLEITKHFGSDEALRAALHDAYRLAPDRRFVLAFSEVQRILTGTARDVSTLIPELADWTDVMPLLEASAAETLATHPLNLVPGKATPALAGVTHAMDRSWTGGTLSSLAELEKLWVAGNRHEALFRQIVRGHARLSFQLVDDTRQADIVGARAMALVAIARASKLDVTEDEALTAASLGYWRAARSATGSMKPGSAIRAFLERRDGDLRKLARTGSDGAIARYFLLRRMTALQDAAGVDAVVRELTPAERGSEQVIAAYIALGRLGTKVNGGVALVSTVLDSTRKEAKISAVPAKGSSPVTLFEDALVTPPAITGTFVDEDHRRAFRRAHFYTGLHSVVRHAVDELGSQEAARGFRAQLGAPAAGPGADFVQWLDVLLAADAREADGPALASRMSQVRARGALQARLFREVRESVAWGDPVLSPATRTLVNGLDARPEDRKTLGEAARESLQAFDLSERLYTSYVAVTAGEDPRVEAYVARIRRDVPTLVRIAADTRLSGWGRSFAVEKLMEMEQKERGLVSKDVVDAHARKLLLALPDDWGAHQRYIEWLHEQDRHADVERVAQRWIRRNGKRRDLGLEPATAMTRLARAQQAQGKLDQAWKTIQPALESGAFGPLSRGSRILLARGKNAEAMKIAKGLEDRYGRQGSVFVAELHWRAGRNAEATAALLAAPKPLAEPDWETHVGDTFADVFEGRIPEAVAAMGAMQSARVPLKLQWLLTLGINDGALKFAVLGELRPTVEGMALSFVFERWKAKKVAEGEAAANAWLRTQPNWQAATASVFFLYQMEAWNLVWDTTPPAEAGDAADNFWEFRTMAALRAKDEKRIAEMKARYQQTPKGGRYDLLARYLLDLVPQEEIVPLAAGRPGYAAEVAMVIAVRREASGNLAAANDWYRAVVETGARDDAEYRAANYELNRWYDKTWVAKAN